MSVYCIIQHPSLVGGHHLEDICPRKADTHCRGAGLPLTRLLDLIDIVMKLIRTLMMERRNPRPKGWMLPR